MKKLIVVSLGLLLGCSAFAQEHQCANPGEVIKRDFVKVRGEYSSLEYAREGADSIPSTGKLTGEIKAKTFKVFHEVYCKETIQAYSEEVCQPINVSQALGKGNAKFRSFFDFSLPLMERSEKFAKTIAFFETLPGADRLEFSRQIVTLMGQAAASQGIPQSWDSFSLMLTSFVTIGQIPQSVVDDILIANREKNENVLGFKPMADVQYSEAKGNGELQKLFNLNLSVQVRANLIQSTLDGVSATAASSLSIVIIQFAATNGIPENWNQFVLMMKDAVKAQAISEEEYKIIVVAYEDLNRANLGYEISAKTCKIVIRSRPVNVIDKREVAEVSDVISKKFEVNISAAPLLRGEKEKYTVNFNGIDKVVFSHPNTYNSYVVSDYKDENDLIKMNILGTRQKITPSNNVGAAVVRNGKIINLRLQNKDFNPLIGGRVQVRVDFYEVIPMWPDFKLGSKVFTLENGEVTDIASQISMRQANRKIRLDISVQITGSAYFNDKFSKVIEHNNL